MSTQKITMGRDKRQDAIDAENAMRQSGANPFVRGIDAVMNDGVGTAISETRNRYGNVNVCLANCCKAKTVTLAIKIHHITPLLRITATKLEHLITVLLLRINPQQIQKILKLKLQHLIAGWI